MPEYGAVIVADDKPDVTDLGESDGPSPVDDNALRRLANGGSANPETRRHQRSKPG